MFIWPFIHAVLAALITTWDVLPPTSKAYDMVPTHIVARLGKNATLDKVVTEWVRDTWRWGEPALNPSVALTWVNGINYTNDEMEEQARFLSSLFGCRVRPYYNPSLGWWLRDLTRVSYMYIRSPTEDPVVTGLAKHLSMVLREVGPKGRVVHLAHSGGALLTYLVAKYHLKEADRRRIDVLNFGGARSITQKYFGKAVNYYARNDPILLVNRRAMNLMQQVMNESADGEVIYLKHNTSFVFLQGRAGDALTDHSLVGPTYLTALHKEAATFRRAYYRAYWLEALTIAKPAEMGWGRYLRKRTAAATGFHNYFSNSTLVRLYYGSAWGAYSQPTGASSTWSNTTQAVLRLPKRFRKYLRKRYYKWTNGTFVSSSSSSSSSASAGGKGKTQIKVVVRRGRLPVDPAPPDTSNRTSWLSIPPVVTSWLSNRTQPPEPLLPKQRRGFLRLGSSGDANHDHNNTTSLLAMAWEGGLNASSAAVANLTGDVVQRVRWVRKRAARMTGMRHFFAGKERREEVLAQEAAAAAAAAEALVASKKATRGNPFLFFLRGNSGKSVKDEISPEQEVQVVEKSPSMEDTNQKEEHQEEEREEKEEKKKKVEVEEEEKKEEKEKEAMQEIVAPPPPPAQPALEPQPVATEMPMEDEEPPPLQPAEAVEEGGTEAAAVVTTAAAASAVPLPQNLVEGDTPVLPPEREQEGDEPRAQKEDSKQKQQEEGKDVPSHSDEGRSSSSSFSSSSSSSTTTSTKEEAAGSTDSSDRSLQCPRRGARSRLRIKRLKEEDSDLPLSAYLEQGEVICNEDETYGREEKEDREEARPPPTSGQLEENKGEELDADEETESEDDYLLFDAHELSRKYFDDSL